MLKVHAIGLPRWIVRNSNQSHSLPCGFHTVARHHFSIGLCHRLRVTILILHIVPSDLVAHLGIGLVVLLRTETLAIDDKFHLVGIGIGYHLQFGAWLAVPVVAHAIIASLHTVPHLVALVVDHSDVDHRFLILEETLHVEGFRLGFKRYVKHALCPSLGGPSLTLSEIVDGSPICQSDDLVEVHGEIVLAHSGHSGFTLIELHPRKTSAVTGEIHISVVIGLHIGNHGEVTWKRVCFPVAVTGMHGHGDKTGGVVSLN